MTPDRVPFFFMPDGCPSWAHHVYTVYGLACAVYVWERGRSLRVSLEMEEPDRQQKGEAPVDKAQGAPYLFFEVVPLICAALSLLYLISAMYLRKSVSAQMIYHLAFSWLRPAYVLVFTLYWLKRFE